ncbi:hypothetical protein [Streptomyces sp. NPDC005784]|uniref:hypothetical protein n=1 Tax=Streptomyces sp. NPDC005784 TaxID=3364731 RepID=UPI0036C92E5D
MADESAADRRVRTKDALARACAELEDRRALLRETGAEAVLDRLLSVVRSGGDVEPELDELHETLLQCGDAAGLYGDGLRGPGARPDVLPAADRADVVFLCPASRCSRLWWPDESREESPTCSLSGEALRWARV